jgi:transposase-like protein
LADAAGPCRHAVGDRWYVDETYVKIAGRWRYVYRAVDQHGQIIDVYVSAQRDTQAARRFFITALRAHGEPVEVVTDRAWTLLAVVDELVPAAFHNTAQYARMRLSTVCRGSLGLPVGDEHFVCAFGVFDDRSFLVA